MEIQKLNPYWITGFTDGEGSFCLSFTFRTKSKYSFEPRLSFSITQHKRSVEALKLIQIFFNVGFIRFSKKDNCYKYEVRSTQDLNIIIKHFKNYPLVTLKKNSFELFCKCYDIIKQNLHNNEIYYQELVRLSTLINPESKRKYTERDLLKFI